MASLTEAQTLICTNDGVDIVTDNNTITSPASVSSPVHRLFSGEKQDSLTNCIVIGVS